MVRYVSMSDNILEQKLSSMRKADAEIDYCAVTMLGTPGGRIWWSVQSNWVGFTDDDPPREIRAAASVKPNKIIELWLKLKQSYIVVDSPEDLLIFHFVGGNALVSRAIAEQFQPEWIEPRPVARTALMGYHPLNDLPDAALNRAPTPKHRMRILKRDGFRCRICGRSPKDYTDIELHIHHIRPWSRGGLTHDDNLITLCHTCHKGFDPHEDWNLYSLIDKGFEQLDVNNTAREYWEGVRLYRQLALDNYAEVLRANQTRDT